MYEYLICIDLGILGFWMVKSETENDIDINHYIKG